MGIEFTPDIEKLLKALARTGKFGSTPEEVVKHIIQYKAFSLPDIMNYTIAGLLLLGESDEWIIRNIRPGHNHLNKISLAHVKKDWTNYTTEPLPSNEE